MSARIASRVNWWTAGSFAYRVGSDIKTGAWPRSEYDGIDYILVESNLREFNLLKSEYTLNYPYVSPFTLGLKISGKSAKLATCYSSTKGSPLWTASLRFSIAIEISSSYQMRLAVSSNTVFLMMLQPSSRLSYEALLATSEIISSFSAMNWLKA